MYKHFPHGLRILIPVFLAVSLCAAVPVGAALTGDEQTLLSRISAAEMMRTIERLCSDEFRGRRAGSPEHYKAVDYLASRFAESGLQPVDAPGADGFRQPLTMRYSLVRSVDDIKADVTYAAAGDSVPKSKIFQYSGYNGRGGLDIRSQVVFVGYGIQDPASGRDDYENADVAGKVVVWIEGGPSGAKRIASAQKMLTAYQHGAVACLIYRPSGIAEDFGTNVGLAGHIADFPCIAVDKSLAAELLGRDPSTAPVGSTGADVRLVVPPICDPERETSNVIGMLPGSDPDVAREIILVGAHFDHIGDNGPSVIFRGADDNASGTSVVVETMRAIARSGLKPRRTIVFASWTGEECGLVGSNYFTANPLFPLKSIKSHIEVDMVGAGDSGLFRTTGARAYPDHYRCILTSAADLGLDLDPDSIRGASDHLAFARKRVPSSLISSAGEHPNYHTVRDTPSAIDRGVLESAARLTALSVWRAAND